MKQLLPAVADTVDRRCLVERVIDALETCDEGKEGCTERGPEGDHDTKRHYVLLVFEELNGFGRDTKVNQENRIKLMLAVAKERLNAPVEAKPLTAEEIAGGAPKVGATV